MAEEKPNSISLTAVLKQAQVILTLTYLLMVGVGMLYYHEKYSEFGINIFQYADILYFLVAPFEDSFIFVLCVIAVVVFAIGYLADAKFRNKFPRAYSWMSLGMVNKPWYQKFLKISWPLAFISILFIYADLYGQSTKEDVLESEKITIKFADGETLSGQLIGKTGSVLFVIHEDRVKVLPMDSLVKEIDIGPLIHTESEPPPETMTPAK